MEKKTIKMKTNTKIKKFDLGAKTFTKIEDLKRINEELNEKAKKGLLIGLRQEADLLEIAEPSINGIWDIFLNDAGNIVKIVLW